MELRKSKFIAMGVITVNGEFGDLYIPPPADIVQNMCAESQKLLALLQLNFLRAQQTEEPWMSVLQMNNMYQVQVHCMMSFRGLKMVSPS